MSDIHRGVVEYETLAAIDQLRELARLPAADAVSDEESGPVPEPSPILEQANIQVVENFEAGDVQEEEYVGRATAEQPMQDLFNCVVLRFVHGEMEDPEHELTVEEYRLRMEEWNEWGTKGSPMDHRHAAGWICWISSVDG
jgi:hypothetical protein